MMGSELQDFRTRVDGHVDHLVGLHLAHHPSSAIRLARAELLDLIDAEVEQRTAEAAGGVASATAGWLIAGLLFVVLLAVWPHLCP